MNRTNASLSSKEHLTQKKIPFNMDRMIKKEWQHAELQKTFKDGYLQILTKSDVASWANAFQSFKQAPLNPLHARIIYLH